MSDENLDMIVVCGLFFFASLVHTLLLRDAWRERADSQSRLDSLPSVVLSVVALIGATLVFVRYLLQWSGCS